jgi:hypothetical protein
MGDGDIRTLTGKGDGRGAPDSGITTGNKSLATCQSAGTAIALLTMVRGRIHVSCKTWSLLRLIGKRRCGIDLSRIL